MDLLKDANGSPPIAKVTVPADCEYARTRIEPVLQMSQRYCKCKSLEDGSRLDLLILHARTGLHAMQKNQLG